MKRMVWIFVLVPLALTLLTGCTGSAPTPPRPSAPATTPAATTTPRALASPRSTAPGEPQLPPGIGTAGSSGPPPSIVLPAPAESRPAIERLIARFGLRSLKGSGATAANVERLEASLALFARPLLRDLEVVIEPAGDESSGPNGVWMLLDAAGAPIAPDAPAAPASGARILLLRQTPTALTMTHEVGHHVTIYEDAAFGRNLVESLGYELTDAGGATDPIRVMDVATWAPTRVRVVTGRTTR